MGPPNRRRPINKGTALWRTAIPWTLLITAVLLIFIEFDLFRAADKDSISLQRVFKAFLYVAVGLYGVYQVAQRKISFDAFGWITLGFFIWQALTVFYNPFAGLASVAVALSTCCVALYTLWAIARSQEPLKVAVQVLTWSLRTIVLVSAALWPFMHGELISTTSDVVRYRGILAHAAGLTFVSTLLFLTEAIGFANELRRRRWTWMLPFLLASMAVGGLMLQQASSRTGMAALPFGMAMAIILAYGWSGNRFMLTARKFLLPVAPALVILGPPILTLFGTEAWEAVATSELFQSARRGKWYDDVTTFSNRSLIWDRVLELSLQRPLTGYGFHSSDTLLVGSTGRVADSPGHSHNAGMEALLTMGVPGLIAMMSGLGFLAVRLAAKAGEHGPARVTLNAVFYALLLQSSMISGPIGHTTFIFLVLIVLVAACSKKRPKMDASLHPERPGHPSMTHANPTHTNGPARMKPIKHAPVHQNGPVRGTPQSHG